MSEVRKPSSDPPRRHENMTGKERLQIHESERMWCKVEDLGARSERALWELELLW